MKYAFVFFLVLLGGIFLLISVAAAESSSNKNLLRLAKSRYGARNPCMTKNTSKIKNPCAIKAGASDNIKPLRKKAFKNKKQALKYGKKLWKDTELGKAGVSCASCHPKGTNIKKAPFPRYIKMANDVVTLDQMINFCMVNPMKGKPLRWRSQQMTALAAYTQKLASKQSPKNPCRRSNPYSGKNPCAAH